MNHQHLTDQTEYPLIKRWLLRIIESRGPMPMRYDRLGRALETFTNPEVNVNRQELDELEAELRSDPESVRIYRNASERLRRAKDLVDWHNQAECDRHPHPNGRITLEQALAMGSIARMILAKVEEREMVAETRAIGPHGNLAAWPRRMVLKYLRPFSLGPCPVEYGRAKHRYRFADVRRAVDVMLSSEAMDEDGQYRDEWLAFLQSENDGPYIPQVYLEGPDNCEDLVRDVIEANITVQELGRFGSSK